MTTLADLTVNDQVLFAFVVTAVDGITGMSVSLYGPGRDPAATAVIAPSGAMTGQLAAPANQVPVTLVTGFAPVSTGDVMQNTATGETLVAMWSQIGLDGTVTWSSSADHKVVYTASGWNHVGHVTL